jgi:hypothetical protein
MPLLHFSEDPNLTVFHPRFTAGKDDEESPIVWAIDEAHAFLYYFPRDCPRVVCWPLPGTSDADKANFFGHTSAKAIVAVEGTWLGRIADTRLYVYRLPSESFTPTVPEGDPAFYGAYVSRETVYPLSVEPVGDLLAALAKADAEIRVMPSLWPLWDAVVLSTLHFSGIRLRKPCRRRLDAPWAVA